MNNRTQQRFDRSIAEAVAATKIAETRRAPRAPNEARDHAVAADMAEHKRAGKRRGWVIYRDPVTGGTVYGPRP